MVTLNPSQVDERAKQLLMLVHARRDTKERAEPTQERVHPPSLVEKEAHRLLHLLGHSNLSASHARCSLQADRVSSFLHIDASVQRGQDRRQRVSSLRRNEASDLDGALGEHGGDIHLHLEAKNGIIEAKWKNHAALLHLGKPSVSIFLRSVGGHGGHGLSGLNGRPGKKGGSGIGGDGETGQDGKNGGNGGHGGNGGQIKVYVNPQDTDLLMLLNVPDVSGGIGGRPGAGGIGGEGGAGGEGKPALRPYYLFPSNAPPILTFLPLGPTRYGNDGKKGDNGRRGSPGATGKSGSFSILVEDIAYASRYDVLMTVSKVIDVMRGNPLDCYEPGEEVRLMATVTNRGGMPTPMQGIQFFLQPADWMQPNTSSLILSKQLAVGESHVLSPCFSFTIREHNPCSEPFHRRAVLTYRAIALRVNKSFASISKQQDLFTLTYPVQLTSLVGNICHREWNQDALVTVSATIENTFTTGMGRNSLNQRRVYVIFELKGNDALDSIKKEQEIADCASRDHGSTCIKEQFELDDIPPESQRQIKASFRISESKKVEVIAFVYLNLIGKNEMRCIQQKRLCLS